MNNFKNLKIAITDETHLKAVCDVLESIGYKFVGYFDDLDRFIQTFEDGEYCGFMSDQPSDETVNLSDLLKMRDDMVKANAKSS